MAWVQGWRGSGAGQEEAGDSVSLLHRQGVLEKSLLGVAACRKWRGARRHPSIFALEETKKAKTATMEHCHPGVWTQCRAHVYRCPSSTPPYLLKYKKPYERRARKVGKMSHKLMPSFDMTLVFIHLISNNKHCMVCVDFMPSSILSTLKY
jgi:hypothetical protein